MSIVFRTLITPATHADLARAICAALAPSGGAAMFEVGLSADGVEPATHYVSTGMLDADFAALMPLTEWTQDENGEWVWREVSHGRRDIVVALCAESGLEVSESEVIDLFSASDVTEQEAFTAFDRLGLRMVQEDANPAS